MYCMCVVKYCFRSSRGASQVTLMALASSGAIRAASARLLRAQKKILKSSADVLYVRHACRAALRQRPPNNGCK